MNSFINTSACNLIGAKISLPTGAAAFDGKMVDDVLIDGDKVTKSKIQWFPKKKLSSLYSSRTRLDRLLELMGFNYLASIIVHDDNLDSALNLINTEFNNIQTIKDDIENKYGEILADYWSEVERTDGIEKANLMRAHALPKDTFLEAISTKSSPVLKFHSADATALENEIEDAVYKTVSDNAAKALKSLIEKNGSLKTSLKSIKAFYTLEASVKALALTVPDLSFASKIFSDILKKLPESDLEQGDISVLSLWSGILRTPTQLKDICKGIEKFDISALGFLPETASIGANPKTTKVKAKATTQMSFLDL